MTTDIAINDPVDINMLRQRWPGVSDCEIAKMVENRELIAHIEKYRKINPNSGSPVAFASQMKTRIGTDSFLGNIIYEWDSIVFSQSNIREIEEAKPHLKWISSTDEADDTSSSSEAIEENAGWVNCDTLSNRWRLSPFDVVGILRNSEIPVHADYSNDPIVVDTLDRFSVHSIDLLRWEAENADKINNAPVLAQDGARLRSENKELSAKAARLEAQNATLRSELEACSRGGVIPPKQPKTAPATEAASSRGVDRWKGFAAQMVKVAFDCATEGAKPRKRPQLQAIAKRHGGELSKTALEVLWAALPAEHKSTEPGPPRQS